MEEREVEDVDNPVRVGLAEPKGSFILSEESTERSDGVGQC